MRVIKFQSRLFLIATALLIVAASLTIYVNHQNAWNIAHGTFETYSLAELQALSSKVKDTQNVANRKMSICCEDLRQNGGFSQIVQADTYSQYADLLKNLQYTLMAEMTIQSEFYSLFVVTDKFVVGYDMNENYSFLYNQQTYHDPITGENAVAAIQYDFPQYAFLTKDAVVSQIDSSTYLIGFLNWSNVFSEWKGQKIYLYDDTGNCLFPGKNSLKMNQLNQLAERKKPLRIGRDSYAVFMQKLPDFGIKVYLLADKRNYTDPMKQTFQKILVFDIPVVLVTILILYYVSKSVVKPLEQFTASFDSIRGYYDTTSAEEFIQSRRHKLSLERKIFYTYSLIFIPLTVLILICLSLYMSMIKTQELSAFRQTSSQSINEIADFLQNQVQYSSYISLDPGTQSKLSNYYVNKSGEAMTFDAVRQYMNDYSVSKTIRYIKIYDTAGKLLFSTSSNDNTFSPEVKYNTWIAQPGYISLYKRIIYSTYSNSQMPYFTNLGCLEIALDCDILPEKGKVQNGFQCISTADGNIIELNAQGRFQSSQIQDIVNENKSGLVSGKSLKIEGQDGFLTVAKIEDTDWLYISFLSESQNQSQGVQLLLFSFVTILALFIIIDRLANLFAKEALKPIRQLENYMRNVTTGQNPDLKFDTRYNEFVKLAENFQKMLLRLNALDNELRTSLIEKMDLEKRRKEADCVAIQSQINPHFLHNILSTIIMLIKMQRDDEAVRMLQATGRMFRSGINKDTFMVPVKDELEHVYAYVELQKIKHLGNLAFSAEAGPDIESLYVPKLILQPLVENAIEHNSKDNRPISIRISFRAENDRLRIVVGDNGAGIGEQEIKSIRQRLKNNVYSGHIGLVNINQRIQLSFGEGYGLKIERGEPTGTNVILTLPVLHNDGKPILQDDLDEDDLAEDDLEKGDRARDTRQINEKTEE